MSIYFVDFEFQGKFLNKHRSNKATRYVTKTTKKQYVSMSVLNNYHCSLSILAK